jgi:hypothetical protein
MTFPIFEPELSFLQFGCNECGARMSTQADLDLHRRETCWRSRKPSSFVFELPGGRGVADGGRRT